jgi:diguanylate cyclase (GGDEF)-like protein
MGVTDPGRILGKPVADALHPDSKERVMRMQQLAHQTGSMPWQEEKILRFDGRAVDVELAGVPFPYEGKPAIQIIFRDISGRKQIEERLKRLALYDELTGLPNRSLFYDRVRQLLEMAKRNHYVLALLYIDLDRFKQVNDTLGHEMGDLLLKEVSRRLTSSTRKADTVARVGGDEFVGICGKIEASADATVVARKIIGVLSQPFLLRDNECTIGASIGISLYPEDGEDMETLLNKADAAMYQVKQNRKGGYLLYRDLKKG